MSYTMIGVVPADAVANYNLRSGSTGEKVMEVQGMLNVWGASPPLAVDGVFGPLTLAAVKAFQSSNGLAADGFVGPETSRALQDDDSKSIGAKAPSLPIKSSGGGLPIAGILVGVGVLGVAIAVAVKMKKGGIRGVSARRRNPRRRRARRRGNYVYGARTRAEAIRLARKHGHHDVLQALLRGE